MRDEIEKIAEQIRKSSDRELPDFCYHLLKTAEDLLKLPPGELEAEAEYKMAAETLELSALAFLALEIEVSD